MNVLRRPLLWVAMLLSCLPGCRQGGPDFRIDYESFVLDNGLEVVLHEDRSDPITAVSVLYHVGKAREEVGKTGLAHLFEHMMFQSSQHVGQDQFFGKIESAGGTTNGSTWSDFTDYFAVVPNNALEMALWLEADRMGYLLPSVTQEAFNNQQAVVQNEKRGSENRPYSRTNTVVNHLMYPENHPYSWNVTGSMADLANATVQDMRDFFTRWYGPNNATLVVAGDYDREQTVAWIEKYFGEIPAADPVPDPAPRPATLTETRRAYREDDLVRSPELTMVFPTVEEYHDDAYALNVLGRLFSDGKRAPLYQVIVQDQKLAPSVTAFNSSRELAGEFWVRVRAFPGKSLSDVEAAVHEAFLRFEADGFTAADLDRIKARTETDFYDDISMIGDKAFQLARYNELAGSPGFIEEDIAKSLAVTVDDVWRVFNQYIRGRNYVLSSFVPRGRTDLVANGSELFEIEEESIAQAGAGLAAMENAGADVEPIPSSFDRSVEPAKGPSPTVTLPEIWTHTFSNGLRLYGVEHTELPLVRFSLTLKGGLLLDDIDKVGVASLLSDIIMEGTRDKTPVQLEEAIDELGASISLSTGPESTVIRARGLTSRVQDIYDLVEEILLEPRWDGKEFARIKEETIEALDRAQVDPRLIAINVFNKLAYGTDHILGNVMRALEPRGSELRLLGSLDAVEQVTLTDLQAYYEANYSPSVAHISIVGDITEAAAIELFSPLEAKWAAREVSFPQYDAPELPDRSRLYFVDTPGARQSQIHVGHPGISRTDPEYYATTVMNYGLGGSVNSVLSMILREEKGYTYGAWSEMTGGSHPGLFMASARVQANATLASAEIFRDEIARYREGVGEEDLTFVKNALIQSNARRFETLDAIESMLDAIAIYNLPMDYVLQEQSVVEKMTLDEHRRLSQEYIHPDNMIYLIVGDSASQLRGLESLGLGTPIRLDADGSRVR